LVAAEDAPAAYWRRHGQYRWTEGHYDTVPTLIADLVRRRVAVIVIPGGTASVLAAKMATQTIPIIFNIGSNPVEIGLVRSLNRPGGNLTGATGLIAELGAKRLAIANGRLRASSRGRYRHACR
jgi:putative ABC transport system substrate-binding protein